MPEAPPPSLQALLAERDWIRALAARLVRDPHAAEDLAQETLTIALERPPQGAGSARAWLATVVRNLVRQERRRPLDPVRLDPARQGGGSTVAASLATDEIVERAEVHQLVVREVLALGEPYRGTLLLRYFEGLSPRVIAAQQRVPLSTVTSRLTRAHAQMRERLDRTRRSGKSGALLLVPLLQPASRPPLALPLILFMSAKLKAAAAAVLLVIAALVGSQLISNVSDAPDLDLAGARDGGEEAELELEQIGVGAGGRVSTQAAPAEEVAPEAAPPVLTGTVLGIDGKPFEGATVSFGRAFTLDGLVIGGAQPEAEAPRTEAGPGGRFAFAEVPTGARFVCADAPDAAPSEPVRFEAGDSVVLRLRRGGRIWGEVVRKDGSVAKGRRIRFFETQSSVGSNASLRHLYAETDESGAFDVRHLAPATWGLTTYPEDEELAELGGDMTEHMVQATFTLEDGQEEYIALGAPSPDAVAVSGRVTLAGEPAAGGLMQWIQECDDPMGSQQIARVAADGSYEVLLPAPGAWWMRVSGGPGHGEYTLDVPKAAEHALDFALPEGRIVGRVLDPSGEPVRYAQVSHVLVEGGAHRSPLRGSDDRRSSNKAGEFELTGLTPGTYRVGAEQKSAGVAESTLVQVPADGAPATVELRLRPGQRIGGTVVDASGAPVRLAPIWIYDESGRLLNPVSSTATDKAGAFETASLPPGEYALFCRVNRSQALLAGVQVGSAPPAPVALKLAPGAVVVAQAFLADAPARADVRVRDRDGRLFSGLRYMRDPWSWKSYPNGSLERHVGPLPPGTYRVEADFGDAGRTTETVTLAERDRREVVLKVR